MTLAERIAGIAMYRLGFREPPEHPRWDEIVGVVQKEIDREMEAMARIAVQDARRRRRGFMEWLRHR